MLLFLSILLNSRENGMILAHAEWRIILVTPDRFAHYKMLADAQNSAILPDEDVMPIEEVVQNTNYCAVAVVVAITAIFIVLGKISDHFCFKNNV